VKVDIETKARRLKYEMLHAEHAYD